MTIFIRTIGLSVALAAAFGSAQGADNKLPEAAANILAKADTIELLALDPEPAKEGFRGYKILGKTELKGDAKKGLMAAFEKGSEGPIDPAKCFNPRHGLRATHDGKTVELVICFECAQFKVHMGDDKGQTLLVNKMPQAAFDKALKDAGIDKSK